MEGCWQKMVGVVMVGAAAAGMCLASCRKVTQWAETLCPGVGWEGSDAISGARAQTNRIGRNVMSRQHCALVFECVVM
jgi:hypothetical protein